MTDADFYARPNRAAPGYADYASRLEREGCPLNGIPPASIQAIGISGLAASGKTTAATYIEQHHGYERRHIAEPLRAMLAELLRWNRVPEAMIPRYLTGDLKEHLIPELGVTSRQAQITLGTEWGRELVHPDLWARTWARAVEPGDRVMNDSVRFPNEEAVIRHMGGVTILILRPGTEPAAFKWGAFGRWLWRTFDIWWGVHDSERLDRLKPDFVIVNDGSLDDLHQQIESLLTCLFKKV